MSAKVITRVHNDLDVPEKGTNVLNTSTEIGQIINTILPGMQNNLTHSSVL